MTLAEFGLFNWLLMYSWNNEGKPCFLENDPKKLCRIIGQPLKAFLAAWVGIQKKFELWIDPQTQLEYFFNRRLYVEYNKRLASADRQSEKGKRRAAEMWKGHSRKSQDSDSHDDSRNDSRTHSHDDSPLQSQSQSQSEGKGNLSVVSPPKPKRTAKPKTEAPEDLEITEVMRGWALSEGFDDVVITRETPAMLDHFRAKGESRQDWVATWRNWLRNSPKFNGKGKGNGNGNGTKEDPNTRAARDFVSRKLAETLQPDLSDVREDVRGITGTVGGIS